MTLYKTKLVIITLILFISGCSKKDDLTLPVKVNFKIGISPENVSSDSYLSFNTGHIGVQRIQFEGKRDAGEDVFFETDPKMNLQPLAFSVSENPVISDFDIPQGIFNYMKWDIGLKRIVTEGLIDNNGIDSLSIGLVISGTYKHLNGDTIPVIIAIDDTEQFSVKSDNPDGNSQIVLSINKDYYEAILLIAPDYAFSSISRESLEEADISLVSGHQIILISRNKNEYLYQNLLYRIDLSVRIIFK
jgi:hypothetical protein